MNHIASYPCVYAVGHRAIADLFADPVVIEEKVDGSQFSMARINGELCCRSKGKDLIVDAPEKMFAKVVEIASTLPLIDGWIYRGEYLQSPKHNTLAYSRVPKNHFILFDVCTGPETYLGPEEKQREADRLGLECVPLLYYGKVESFEQFKSFLERESVLGGAKIEGFVVKNYSRFTTDKKAMIGKYVSEAFKEKHRGEWKKSNPGPSDFVQFLTGQLRTEARWRKAVQHLRERGELTDSPKDIGALIKEVQLDTAKEESDAIKEALYKHFWPQVQRGIIAGLPEWYKDSLAKTVLAPAAV